MPQFLSGLRIGPDQRAKSIGSYSLVWRGGRATGSALGSFIAWLAAQAGPSGQDPHETEAMPNFRLNSIL